jgi:uncharacterized SAM-binding protein YcdF (DUF218 family)
MSTAENAHFVADLLLPRGERRVGVVTCAWHLPRATACFVAAGLIATGIAAAPERGPGVVRRFRERLSLPLDRWLTWGKAF